MTNTAKGNWGLLLAGILALAVSLFFMISGNRQIKRDTEPAAATVTAYEEDLEHDTVNDGTRTVYYPIVSYEVNGTMVESRYSQYSYSQDYSIGSTISIKYNPDDPEEFVIDGDSRIQFGAIWVIPVGGIMIVIALIRLFGPAMAAKKKNAM